jgi:lysyl-tRNA synthetase class 2
MRLTPSRNWHGLTDQEQRYHQRDVNLFSNPDSLGVFLGRSELIARRFARPWPKGYVEGETPTMLALARAAARLLHASQRARHQISFCQSHRSSSEKAAGRGMERVFEIGRVKSQWGLSPAYNRIYEV